MTSPTDHRAAPPPLAAPVALQAQACQAQAGHFDELRGGAQMQAQSQSQGLGASGTSSDAPDSGAPYAGLTGVWADFFANSEATSESNLNQRYARLQRQVRDNGVSYNVYADAEGPQRPWSLDLFPLIIDAANWQHIEDGVQQRMAVLEAVMVDAYGPQHFVQQGLLPSALVHGHPGFLRPLCGVAPVGGQHLHVAAFDLARGPDGLWWVVGQRCQAPSGLGYLLENRLAVSRQFPQAFHELRVQRLASTYRALMESLKARSPAGAQAHIALLTPGPYNETYFEHAYLARYLGLTLVEGSDLMVREERLYLKTLRGLVPVHGLLKRVDDEYLDPLELRSDSTLGVPGLLQAIRAGHVLVANTPGSAFLESPALLGFMPALAREVLGEELHLPALSTWWCGERSAMEEVLPQLSQHTIKPTYPRSGTQASFETVLGNTMDQTALDAWAGRIVRQSEDHTVQAYVPLSQLPVWNSEADGTGAMQARSALLRVFAVSDLPAPDGRPRWKVLPGGLARVAKGEADIASMQRGGSSADVWALTQGEVDTDSLLTNLHSPSLVAQRKRLVTSRAAENLYWLGRYTERTENSLRLAALTLECLAGEDQDDPALLAWLHTLAVRNTLVLAGVPSPQQARRVFERSLIASLGSTEGATSVGYNLRALKMAAAAVRERLSQEHWSVIVQAEQELFARCQRHQDRGDYAAPAALRVLKAASGHLAAITGAQTDRMTRDDGWRLLSAGRLIERLGFLSGALACGLEHQSLRGNGGFEAMLALFDSSITFHAQFQQSRELAALTELLVQDRDNPRSLAWVAHTLRGRLARLEGSAAGMMGTLSMKVPDPADWRFDVDDPSAPALLAPVSLLELLAALDSAAYRISDDISATYFTHAGQANFQVGC